MSYQSKKILKGILAVVAAFFLILYLNYPVLAGFSTVDSYFQQNPGQASAFASQLGISPNVAAPIVPTQTSVPVVAEVLNASGQVIATTYNGTVTTVGTTKLAAVVTGGLAALGIGVYTVDGINKLRDKALAKYKAANPNLLDKVEVAGRGFNSSCTPVGFFSYTFFGTTFEQVSGQFPGFPCTGIQVKVDGQIAKNSDGLPYTFYDITTWQITRNTFEQLTQSQRDAAVGMLTPAELVGELEPSNVSLVPSTFSPDADRVRFTFPDGTPLLTPYGYLPYSQPLEFPVSGSPNIDADSDGIPDSEDPDDDNDGIPDTEDPDDDNDGTPDEYEAESPKTEPIEATKFEAENWLDHGIKVFKTKFPFDIFGDITIAGSPNECPKYTFFDRDFELCPVRDMLSILKVPALIAFMIWAFFSI